MTNNFELVEKLKQICEKPIPDTDSGVAKKVIGGLDSFEKRGLEELRSLFDTSVTEYDFSNCEMTNVPAYFFYARNTVEKVTFPKTIAYIGKDAFHGCTACLVYDFSKCEAVPSYTETAFSSIGASCQIIVPDALYDEWIITGKWADISGHIVKESEV